MDNIDRAARAKNILEEYDRAYTDSEGARGLMAWETVLGDLLSDFMHHCREQGLSFEDAMANAEMHFTAEVEEEHDRHTCDWCGTRPLNDNLTINAFNEPMCDDCARRCCSTCHRSLDNPASEHKGCSMQPIMR